MSITFPLANIRRHAFAAAGIVILGFSAMACSDPRVKIDGEIRADGSCTVTVNGTPVFSPSAHPTVTFPWIKGMNVTSGGREAKSIACTDWDSAARERRVLVLILYTRGGEFPAPGTYTIRQTQVQNDTPEQLTTRADIALTTPEYDWTMLEPFVRYDLKAQSGTVVLKTSDSLHVTGTFHVMASHW
jgi:hypothetical protein